MSKFDFTFRDLAFLKAMRISPDDLELDTREESAIARRIKARNRRRSRMLARLIVEDVMRGPTS